MKGVVLVTDSKIVDMLWSRDEGGISECEKKYKKYSMKIAYRILGDLQDSEECTSDTFLAAWNTIPPKRPENLKTYLAKLARNLSLNRYKTYTAEKRGGGAVDTSMEEIEACLPSRDSTEAVVDSVVLTDLLDRFLAELPKETRIMFVQRYWYFMSVKDIAEDLYVTESKVKITLMRTRKKLAELLEKEGFMHTAEWR